MHSRRIVFALVGSLFAVAACATGTVSSTGGGSSETGGDASLGDTGASYGWGDEGGPGTGDAAPLHPPKDGGTTTPIDSGTVTVLDAGGGSTSGFCSGSTSSLDGDSYDDWCDYDYYYQDFSGSDFACASNDDCQDFGATGCCFKPPSGSACRDDYGTQPQCVPQ